MKYHTQFSMALAATLSLFLSACASTHQIAHFPDQQKRIEDPSKARIYVMRPALFGTAISIDVSDGSTPIGNTGPRSYLCWERPPGDAILTGKAENASLLTLPVTRGNIYYVRQSIYPGVLLARNSLDLVSEKEGQETLKKCKPPQPSR